MQTAHLDWPFFDAAHRTLAERARSLGDRHDCITSTTRRATRTMRAAARWSPRSATAAGCASRCRPAFGGALETLDSRALCIVRETLAYHDGLADFAFAMQGLGSGAITIAGDDALQRAYLPRVADGERDRGVRAVGAGRRLGRRGDEHARGRRRRPTSSSTAARRGSRTAASPTSTRSSRGRPTSRARAASAPSSSTRRRRASTSRAAST